MNLCLDISACLAQTAGIGRYARELALVLQAQASAVGVAISLFHNRQPISQLPAALIDRPRSMAPLGNKAWRAFLLTGLPMPSGWEATIRACEIFHGLDVVTPSLRQPVVITIHDLTTRLFPQHHSLFNRVYMRLALPVMVKRATTVLADSESTRQDIIRLLGVDAQKVRTVYPGVDHGRFSPRDPAVARAQVAANLGVRPPYLLALGTLEPRKNLSTLLRAYAALPTSAPKLVLTGSQGWGEQSLAATVEHLKLGRRVHLTGYVADDLLPALYSGAELFVYPSLYEGFGLPVLEAMACGAPVITSNVSSLPEVAGDAALLVDPRSPDQLAVTIQSLLEAPGQRDRLRQAGLARAQTFSWTMCANDTLRVYRQVLEAG